MSAEKLLLFLVMLSVLVVLHEYGHFLLARRNGVRVDDFALGMGPTLLKWTSKRSGTNYRLNLFPIGGYCAMKGEDGKTTEAEQQRAFRNDGLHDDDNFQAKTPLQRLAIVVAGPVANFIVALVLLFVSYAVFGVADRAPTTKVYQLVPGYPAQKAGLHPGDVITQIDGVTMRDGDQLVHTIYASPGKTLHVTYVRDGRPAEVDIVTKTVPDGHGKAQGRLGFSPMPAMRPASIPEAAVGAWSQFGLVFMGTLNVLGQLVTNFSATMPASCKARSALRKFPRRWRISAGDCIFRSRRRSRFRSAFSTCCRFRRSMAVAASLSWSRCCAANRSIRKKKRSCTSAVLRR